MEACDIMVIVLRNGHGYPISNSVPDSAFSLHANVLGKGMNPYFLP